MGIFDFFKSGGVLGQMAEVIGKLYLKSNLEEKNELKNLLILVITRFMFSVFPDKKAKVVSAFTMLREMSAEQDIGVLAVCFTIASIEMDVVGIEDYVIKTIKKNLEKVGLNEEQIFGKSYSESEFDSAIKEFGF